VLQWRENQAAVAGSEEAIWGQDTIGPVVLTGFCCSESPWALDARMLLLLMVLMMMMMMLV
jgi:hypothetical protein